MNIDHNLPIYIRIQETLRKGILQGVYQPGDRLPSETELAKQFSTTRATVVHAMQGLTFDGLIERTQGRGTFVAQSTISTTVDTQTLGFFEKDMVGSGKTVEYRLVSFKAVPTSEQLQKQLNLSQSDSVHELLRLRLVDGRPFAVERRYMPSLTALRINPAHLQKQAIQSIFQDQLGLTIATIGNQVRVALVAKDIAEWLEIKPNRPVMVRTHSYFDSNNLPMLWGQTVYREEYEIHYRSQQKVVGHIAVE